MSELTSFTCSRDTKEVPQEVLTLETLWQRHFGFYDYKKLQTKVKEEINRTQSEADVYFVHRVLLAPDNKRFLFNKMVTVKIVIKELTWCVCLSILRF